MDPPAPLQHASEFVPISADSQARDEREGDTFDRAGLFLRFWWKCLKASFVGPKNPKLAEQFPPVPRSFRQSVKVLALAAVQIAIFFAIARELRRSPAGRNENLLPRICNLGLIALCVQIFVGMVQINISQKVYLPLTLARVVVVNYRADRSRRTAAAVRLLREGLYGGATFVAAEDSDDRLRAHVEVFRDASLVREDEHVFVVDDDACPVPAVMRHFSEGVRQSLPRFSDVVILSPPGGPLAYFANGRALRALCERARGWGSGQREVSVAFAAAGVSVGVFSPPLFRA